jgi:hypothetical protein
MVHKFQCIVNKTLCPMVTLICFNMKIQSNLIKSIYYVIKKLKFVLSKNSKKKSYNPLTFNLSLIKKLPLNLDPLMKIIVYY